MSADDPLLCTGQCPEPPVAVLADHGLLCAGHAEKARGLGSGQPTLAEIVDEVQRLRAEAENISREPTIEGWNAHDTVDTLDTLDTLLEFLGVETCEFCKEHGVNGCAVHGPPRPPQPSVTPR